jgi:hypothetical protein
VPDAGIFTLLWKAFRLGRSIDIVSMEKTKGPTPRRDISREAFTGRHKS